MNSVGKSISLLFLLCGQIRADDANATSSVVLPSSSVAETLATAIPSLDSKDANQVAVNSESSANATNSGNSTNNSTISPGSPASATNATNPVAKSWRTENLVKALTAPVKQETCRNQITFCDNVCGYLKSEASKNECNKDTLIWTCECKNGNVPNITSYTFPVEFALCTEDLRTCDSNCHGNSDCSIACTSSHNCAAKDVNDGKVVPPNPKPNKAPKVDIFSHSLPSYAIPISLGLLSISTCILLLI